MAGLASTRFPSPVGTLEVVVDGEGALRRVRFLEDGSEGAPEGRAARLDGRRCAAARHQLEEYFERRRRAFELPLVLSGTPFQERVWRALAEIPYGESVGYGELAGRLGPSAAARAVGRACHENPLPIVIPCHRVVGSAGELVGFGGGLERKARLLDLERGQAFLPGLGTP